MSSLLDVNWGTRLSFSHEQEVRAVIHILGTEARNYPDLKWTSTIGGVPESGFDIPINIPTLVERIYVAPAAEPWFADAVRAVVSRFGLSSEVVYSDLDSEPIV